MYNGIDAIFAREGNLVLKRILSLVFAVCFAVSSAFATGASALGNTKIIRAKNNFDFAKKSTEIVYFYSRNINGSSAESYGEALRILGRTTDSAYNFRRLGADECLVGADGRFVLQFNDYSAYKYALSALRSDAKIVYAEPDVIVTVNSQEESEVGYLSWGVEALGLDKYSQYIAENHDVGASLNVGLKVAIVDTGVQAIDPLKSILVPGYDFVDNDSDACQDTSEDSHGTFIAGIVADCTRNTPVRIMPVRVIESKEAYLSAAVNGIYYAVDNGADVINFSISVTIGPCSSLDEAVEYADKNNVVFVACSGNFKKNTSSVCPANIDSVITVSAINSGLEFSSLYSNYGHSVDVAAPGDGIISYGADGNLKTLSGTSMSAGFISAGAALFMIDNPHCTPSQVQAAIKGICTDLGDEGFDIYYGNGIPDFSKLINNKFVPVTGVTFANESFTANVFDELILDYGVLPSNATNKTVTFSSSNPSVAYIVNGVVYCTSEGVTTITVTTVDGGFADSMTLVVESPKEPEKPVPVDMVIDKTPNKTKYTYKSDEALDLTGIQIIVTYSDSSTKVIYNPIGITAEGFSTAMAGKQNITVEYEGLTDEYEITVGYTWWQMIIRILLLGFLWY